MIVGGWTKFRAVTGEEQELFDKALGSMLGVKYEPFAVATQIVSGTNYRFFCNAETVTNPPRQFPAEVIIYQPLEGEPVVTHISEIE